jgi:SNF2 family DNA or RNA helicase
VLVANTSVAGFGLNLQAARRCILLDCPWTPSALDQAIARLHRAGQTRPVHASLLSVARSIDERVTHILAAKRSVISQLTGALSA